MVDFPLQIIHASLAALRSSPSFHTESTTGDIVALQKHLLFLLVCCDSLTLMSTPTFSSCVACLATVVDDCRELASRQLTEMLETIETHGVVERIYQVLSHLQNQESSFSPLSASIYLASVEYKTILDAYEGLFSSTPSKLLKDWTDNGGHLARVLEDFYTVQSELLLSKDLEMLFKFYERISKFPMFDVFFRNSQQSFGHLYGAVTESYRVLLQQKWKLISLFKISTSLISAHNYRRSCLATPQS